MDWSKTWLCLQVIQLQRAKALNDIYLLIFNNRFVINHHLSRCQHPTNRPMEDSTLLSTLLQITLLFIQLLITTFPSASLFWFYPSFPFFFGLFSLFSLSFIPLFLFFLPVRNLACSLYTAILKVCILGSLTLSRSWHEIE